MAKPRIPASVYRLQFNQHFRFADAKALVPYLHQLGVTDLYTSPLLQARRGSAHGYDVTDPTHLNVELGTDEEFDALVAELHKHSMGLLLDIVPNHMATSSENPWWMDLLEDGPSSPYAAHFDVDWHPPNRSLENKVLLPILGKPYAQVLENCELILNFEQSGFFINYVDAKLPVAVKSYRRILKYRQDKLERALGTEDAAFHELQGILATLAEMPERSDPRSGADAERRGQRNAIKERLWRLYSTSRLIQRFIDTNVRGFNGKKGVAASFSALDRLLADQAYVLAYWRTANEEINYRRFFTISELVGVRVEDPIVFEASHAVVLKLAEKGLVTGFRIDHVDGLRDPLGYLRRLQERLQTDEGKKTAFYVVVEKVLSGRENLPKEWPVYGTTGYDFLNVVNGVFVDDEGMSSLDKIYSGFLGAQFEFDDLVYQKRKQVMESLLSVEMRALGSYLTVLAEKDRYARELSRAELTQALVETTACMDVYRTYVRGFEIKAQERGLIEHALQEAQRRNPELNAACFRFLKNVLLLQTGPHLFPQQREARLAFVMRWQQFTGPITAKGFEDSVLYVYNRLISLNDVGGAPKSTGVTLSQFHEFAQQRRRKWPFGLNTTSTHDTKRAEDVRARINVLSEIPEEWADHLAKWSRWNRSRKQIVEGVSVPTRNEETLLYQTLIGSWPLDGAGLKDYSQRVRGFMIKAVREAMVHTRWTLHNEEHERALAEFIATVLQPSADNRFLRDFMAFQKRVAFYGALNGLAQLLVKIGAPGVPDFYQGSELWDLRLVDPDNRNAVDFERRIRMLERPELEPQPLPELLEHWQDGRIKLFVMAKALHFRRACADLFARGDYVPLGASGKKSKYVLGFCRRYRGRGTVVVVPRLSTELVDACRFPLTRTVWGETQIILPKAAPRHWVNVFTGQRFTTRLSKDGQGLYLHTVLRLFPIALLASQDLL